MPFGTAFSTGDVIPGSSEYGCRCAARDFQGKRHDMAPVAGKPFDVPQMPTIMPGLPNLGVPQAGRVADDVVAMREAPRAATFAEAEAYAAEVGAPIVPGTTDDALEAMADAFSKTKEATRYGPFDRERFINNWRENLGDGITAVTERERLFTQNAVNQAFESKRFRGAVTKYGDVPHIAIHRPSVGNMASFASNPAEFKGGWASYLQRVKLQKYELTRMAPRPGQLLVQDTGGYAAIVRHEYGHHVWKTVNTTEAGRATAKEWLQGFFKIGDDAIRGKITHYSGSQAEEAFSELFSMVTHPLFDRTLFDADVQPMIDIILGLIG